MSEKQLINLRISVLWAIALLLGLRCGFEIAVSGVLAAVFTFAAAVLFCLVAFLRRKGSFIFSVKSRVIFVGMAVLILLGSAYFPCREAMHRSLPEGYTAASGAGRVYAVTEEEEGYFTYALDRVNLDGENVAWRLNITVDEEYALGDVVYFDGDLRRRRLVLYGSVNASVLTDGLCYECEPTYSEKIGVEDSLPLFLNRSIRALLKENITEDVEPIARAILLGDSSGLGKEQRTSYSALGLLHLFAVSGLHIGFLMMIVAFLCKRLPLWAQTLLVGSVLLLYAATIGFSPSVIRAGLMAVLALLAKICGRKYDLFSALGAAALILLVIQPANAFDHGFLLSFCAVASLALLVRPLSKVLGFLPKFFADSLSASVAVGFGMLPLCASFFQSVSLLMPIGNLIVLPLVTVAYILLMLALLVCIISPVFGFLLSLGQLVLEAVDFFVKLLATASVSSLTVYGMGALALPYLLGLVLMGSRILASYRRRALYGAILVFLSFGLYALPGKEPSSLCVTAMAGESFALVQAPDGVKIGILLNANITQNESGAFGAFRQSDIDALVVPEGQLRMSAAFAVTEYINVKHALVFSPEEEESAYFEDKGIACTELISEATVRVGEATLLRLPTEGFAVWVGFGGEGVLLTQNLTDADLYLIRSTFSLPVDLIVGDASVLKADFGEDTCLISTVYEDEKEKATARLGNLTYCKGRVFRA